MSYKHCMTVEELMDKMDAEASNNKLPVVILVETRINGVHKLKKYPVSLIVDEKYNDVEQLSIYTGEEIIS